MSTNRESPSPPAAAKKKEVAKIEHIRHSNKKYKHPCTPCQKQKKVWSQKTLRMYPDGRVELGEDVVFDEDGNPMIAGSASPGRTERHKYLDSINKKLVKKFDKPGMREVAKDLLKNIRLFSEERKGTVEDPRGYGEPEGDKDMFYTVLGQICEYAQAIFKSESRVLAVSSPAFVFGDLHGNIEDLLTFEAIFWKSVRTVGMTVPSFLFLGDFVDRGKWSVETALYLFSLKITAPHKFFLVRGNHEISSISKTFSFHKECVGKYGERLGNKVFDKINSVFNTLPLAAVIDDAIFCCHGGIPSVNWTLLEMQQLPNDLEPAPQTRNSQQSLQDRTVWELLWNDPNDWPCYDQKKNVTKWKDVKNLFEDNTKRGTGKLFNEAAVDRFLEINGLTHILRAHQMFDDGFKIHFGGKVITLFSCSHYSAPNLAACALVDDESVRIIQIDTSENKAAMTNDPKKYK